MTVHVGRRAEGLNGIVVDFGRSNEYNITKDENGDGDRVYSGVYREGGPMV